MAYAACRFEVDHVKFVDELPSILLEREGRRVYLLQGKNSDSRQTIPAPVLEGVPEDVRGLLSETETALGVLSG